MFLLIDFDAFFVSCERLKRPYLKEKPVVVCTGNGDKGVVTSASYEARKFNISSGMPFYMAKTLYPNIVCVQADVPMYASLSKKVMKFLAMYTPYIDIFSIDEAYLDISYYRNNYMELASSLKHKIKKQSGLPASIGIGKSRVIAKIACKMHKPEDIGVVKDHVNDFMDTVKVEDIPGIGKKSSNILKKHGILNAKDLKSADDSFLAKLFGIKGLWFKKLAKGEDAGYFMSNRENTIKSIGHSETLKESTKDKQLLKNYLLYLSLKIFRKAIRLKK